MKKLLLIGVFLLLATPLSWADVQDTVVFKAKMSPDNEVPVVSAPGNSGFATITVHVTRDATGNVNAATVIFDIDYTVSGPTTFTGLHIHNALPGTSGGVVINTGLSGTNTIAATGTGHITKVVNYASGDTGLSYVAGLLDMPENYYANIHSTTQPGGLMRAPLLRTSWTFRPQMSVSQEVPANTTDAEGAATIQVLVNRDNNGAITSGSVSFDVDYRLPAGSTITGLHLHNAATGSNGPVVIDSGINGSTRSITTATDRGNIFRITDIDSSNAAGLAALNGLMTDPTQFYVNIHTTVLPNGLMRGQLSTNTYAFYGQMTMAEENPPTNISAVANTMTVVTVNRDVTGNITSGTVGFNVAYSGFDPQTTFTGLHIHNGPIGVNAAVVINTGLSGTNNVVTATGTGSVNRTVNVDNTTATALTAMAGLLHNPKQYYVNIHTTVFTGGAIRSQLGREVYHYKGAMSPANEVPAVTSNASATGWLTVKISRDSSGVINGGVVTFDVDAVGDGTSTSTTYTGLHIHSGSAAVSGPVVINTGLSGTNNVTSTTGTLNITRVVNIGAADTNSLAMLATLINNPDQAYVNIHTTVSPGGVARAQMMPFVNYVPQVAGGGEWISSVTIANASTSSSVAGIVDTYQHDGTAIPAALVDPSIPFLIPPGGSITVNLHNKGNLTSGFVRVYSNNNVNVTGSYNLPVFPATATVTPITARKVSVPVNVKGPGTNTGIAIYAVTAGQLVLSMRDSGLGLPITGGNATINVTAGQHIVGFVTDLFPGVTLSQYSANLTIESIPATGTGQLSVLGLQFDGALTSVTVTPLP